MLGVTAVGGSGLLSAAGEVLGAAFVWAGTLGRLGEGSLLARTGGGSVLWTGWEMSELVDGLPA